ncbi:MAG: helix-turn-helix domain-containing protein [Acidobacteriota bacterium]
MFRDDPSQDAFKAVAKATRARIQRDRAKAPPSLRKVFTIVASKLFQPSLDATRVWKKARINDSALMAAFTESTGSSLAVYIAKARIDVASVLMATTDLTLTAISSRVGYTYPPTFTDTYRRLKGLKPSEVERKLLPPPMVGFETSLRAGWGLLDADELVSYVEAIMRLCPAAQERIHIRGCPEPQTLIEVDGAHDDELKAEGLWQKICCLPFSEQCQQVRRYLFRSTVLFDLLRKVSRREGHRNRQRGIEVAELALVSLENSEQIFGERIHDLRALAWAWIGNAYGLALDFVAAAAAFEQANREWSQPRAQADPLVLATICNLKGTLKMFQRDYVAATEDLNRSCSLFRQSDQAREEARVLIQRATIHGYAGKLSESLEDLQEAAGLIDEEEDRELAFAIRGNLANTLVRIGKADIAATELDRARQLNHGLDDLGTVKLDWIDGDLSELHGDLQRAKRFYASARTRFQDAEEMRYFGLVSVDLMTINSQLGEWDDVRKLASETIPIITSLDLHSETVAVVGLLAEAVEAQELSRRLVNDVRLALRRDPLTMKPEAGKEPPPRRRRLLI